MDNMENMESIKSLSEYLKFNEKYLGSDFFFRGESGKHEARTPNAFHANDGLRHGKYIDFMELVNEFYSQVAHRISDIEKEQFLAFAQHYGLPTNLLDITLSPLKALFMACYSCEKDEKGYVYFFEKDFLDITEIFSRFPNECLMELLAQKNWEALEMFFKAMHYYNNKFPVSFKKYLWRIIDRIKLCMLAKDSRYDGFEVINQDAFMQLGKIEECEYLQDLLNALAHGDEAIEIGMEMDKFKPGFDAYVYTVMLVYLLDILPRTAAIPFQENFMPNLIYRPKISFERTRLQQDLFIYQPYRFMIKNDGNVRGLYKIQEIAYTHEVEIANPKQMLLELDNVGINVGTLFGDYGSIARYIKEKHEWGKS